jgi:hypothetical protein
LSSPCQILINIVNLLFYKQKKLKDLNQYNIKKTYNNSFENALFWVWQISFGLLLPLSSIFFIWNFFPTNFIGNNFLLRLFFHLSLVILVGGFWFLWIIFWGCWEDGFVEMMIKKYLLLPANSNTTVEIIIPEGFDYDVQNMISYFFYFKNSFRSQDVTKANIYQYGKWHSELTFDFIIQNKVLKIYSTFPRKKYTQFVEGIIRLFPGLIINSVPDPFASWSKEWKEGTQMNSLTEFAGYSFGLRTDGYKPFYKLSGLPKKPSWSSTDNILRGLKESINSDEIVVLQYNFMASPNELPNEKYIAEYEKWRQRMYNSFTPKRNGQQEGEAFAGILPIKERKKNEAYHWRANQTLVQTAIRIAGFSTKSRSGLMENLLDKFGDIFSGDNSREGGQRPEKKHITATSQKYFRHLNRAPEFQYIYDRYIYPSKLTETVLDQMAGPIYQKFYFPNENRLRKKNNYKSLIERDIEAPWDGFQFYSDPIAGAGLLQFPVSAYNPNSFYEKNIVGPAMNLQDNLYDDETDE